MTRRAERAGDAARRYLPWAVFLGAVVLYAATLRRGILPADSGEFQTVAATGGLAHPPGYPLYTVLAWLVAHVPLGPTAAWRVNAFSAFTAAATVALVFSTAKRLTNSVLGGLTAALALVSATTFWATATKASIRPLTAFFTALSLYALTRHASQAAQSEQLSGDSYLVLFSLALSLGLTHHPSLAFPGIVFVGYLLLIDPALLRRPSRWVKPALALLPSLLVFIYLPLRGGANVATLSGFLDYVLARGFRGDMLALGVIDRLVLLPTLLRFQFNDVLLVGTAFGALVLLWRDRRLALLLIGSFVLHTAVTLTYDAPQTVEYEMPAYVVLVLLMVVPFARLASSPSRIASAGSGRGRFTALGSAVCAVVAIAVALASLLNLVLHLPSYRVLSRSRDTRDYVERLLRDTPEGAVVLTNWHWFTPLQYVQQVEGRRPDISIRYVAPRGEPLAETWVRSIEESIGNRPVVVVRFFKPEYSALPYAFEPLGEAFLVRSEPREDVPPKLNTVDAVLGEQIEVLGYRLTSEEIHPAQPVTMELAWSPVDVPATHVALFVQLIGPGGRLWSVAEDPRHAPDKLSPGEVILERFVIYPRFDALPGEYRLVVGAYTSDGRLLAPDGSDSVDLEALTLQPSEVRPVTKRPRFLRLAEGPTLIGVDYDEGGQGQVRAYLHWAGPGGTAQLQMVRGRDGSVSTFRVPALRRGEYATVAVDHPGDPSRLIASNGDQRRRWNWLFPGPLRMPSPRTGERYVPFGDGVILTGVRALPGSVAPDAEAMLNLRFRGQRPLQRDYIVSTSLTGLNPDDTWAWRASHDTVPALGAVPTLKWIRGVSVLDPHRIEIPADLQPAPVVGSLSIYDHFTQRSLPSLDEQPAMGVELGTWSMSP